jgi:hypothetical protein
MTEKGRAPCRVLRNLASLKRQKRMPRGPGPACQHNPAFSLGTDDSSRWSRYRIIVHGHDRSCWLIKALLSNGPLRSVLLVGRAQASLTSQVCAPEMIATSAFSEATSMVW